MATIEPVMAILWAALFLGESLTWPQIKGGASESRRDCVAGISEPMLVSAYSGLLTSYAEKLRIITCQASLLKSNEWQKA